MISSNLNITNLWSEKVISCHSNFVNEGYAIFHGALNNNECKEYSKRISVAKKNGLCVKDPQCPSSSAYYGLFDDLLIKIKPLMEGISGKSLYPTYSYARIYEPGETLEKHTDRPSCEISCTLTLSHKGNDIWPIFFQSRKGTNVEIVIPNGSLAVYMGCELTHWRKKYKQGKQQIQVFLHYIDALGQNKNCIFDGRGKLNV